MKRLFLVGLVLLMVVFLLTIPAMAQDGSNSNPPVYSQSEIWDKVLVLATMFVASLIVLFKEWVGAKTAEKLADYSDPKVTKEVFDEGYRRGLEHGAVAAKQTADPKDDLFWQALIDNSGMKLVHDATGWHVVPVTPAVPTS